MDRLANVIDRFRAVSRLRRAAGKRVFRSSAERSVYRRLPRLEVLEQRTLLSVAAAVDGSLRGILPLAKVETISADCDQAARWTLEAEDVAIAESRMHVALPNPCFQIVDAGDGWQQISADSLVEAGDGGSPALPGRLLRFLLPADVDLSSVSLRLEQAVERVLPGTYRIHPAPLAAADKNGQLTFGVADDAQIVAGKNLGIYGADEYFGPACCVLLDCQQMGRYKIADVYYSPFTYNPVTGSIKLSEGDGWDLAALGNRFSANSG